MDTVHNLRYIHVCMYVQKCMMKTPLKMCFLKWGNLLSRHYIFDFIDIVCMEKYAKLPSFYYNKF